MVTMVLRVRSIGLGMFMLACGPEEESPPPTGDEILAGLVDELPAGARDCGHEIVGLGCTGAATRFLPMRDCLRDALAACEPAYAWVDGTTIEGYTNPELYVVGSDCTITHAVDWSDDPYGGCRVWKSVCRELVDIAACPPFTVDACEESETLLQLEACGEEM